MNSAIFTTGRSRIQHSSKVLLAVLCVVSTVVLAPQSAAECNNGGTHQWRAASTNLYRCGIRGYVTNDTYYSRQETKFTTIKITSTGTVATNVSFGYFQYSGGPFNCDSASSCTLQQGGSNTLTIPTIPCKCPGETQEECDDCNEVFANMLATLGAGGLEELAQCPPTITNQWSVSDNAFIQELEKEYESASHACDAGTKIEITKIDYDFPYHLVDFAEDAISGAKLNWQDGGSSATGQAKLTFSDERACARAELLSYYIKFNSKQGVKYSVTWEILITSNQRTNRMGGGWSGDGDGTEMRLGAFDLPEPQIDETYTAQIINIQVKGDDGCSSGSCGEGGNDSPGDGPDSLASSTFYISLGAGTVEQSAGVLKFDEELPSALLATPAALRFNINRDVVTVVTNLDGTIDLAAPTLMARIVVTNSYAYWVHCSVTNGGGYLTNSPFISHLIINPNGSTNTNTLRHVRFRNGSAITNEFTCEVGNTTNSTWTLISGNGLKGERLAKIYNTNNQTRLESYSIFTPSTSAQLYQRDRLIWAMPVSGDRLLSEVIDPGGLALTTTNTYDAFGHLELSVKPDGSWERREYEPNGWLVRIVTPFTNQPPTASTNDCRVIEYGYGSVAGSSDYPDAHKGEARTVTELIRGEVISKTMTSFLSDYDTYTQVAPYHGAGWNDAGNETSHVSLNIDLQTDRLGNIDGTATTMEYLDDSSGRLTTTRTLNSSGSIIGRVEEQVDPLSRMVSRKTYHGPTGADTLIGEEQYSDPDEFFRPTKVTYLDGTTSVTVKQDCCSAAYSVDRDGLTNTYSYDALKRLVSTTRLGVTTSNLLDAADRVLAQTRRGTNGNLITLRTLGYDAANRIIRETNALAAVTAYSHVVDGSNQRILFTTNADGGTRIETYFRDGQLAGVTGTAAFPVRYEYGRVLDGSYQRAFTKEIKLDASGADTSECVTNFVDAFGHAYKTAFPGTAGPAREMRYNAKGQLTNQIDPDGVRTLFQYNAKGEREYVCIDSNRNDLIDLDGQDRITQTVSDVVANHGTDVLRTRTYVWQTDGSSSSTLLSTSETSVDGLSTWSDTLGVVSTSVKTPPSSGSYTVTQTAPDGFYSVSLYQNGRMASVTRYDSGSSQLGKTTYGYDEHGRRNTSTDARTGTTTYTFNNADQIVSVTSPPPGTGAPAQTTTTYFDAMGRATSIAQADGTTVNNVFSLRGELLRTSGSRTYPVGYSYEAQGRMKTMTNWSTFSSSTGARVTTWHYDAQRGWMTNKVYDDSKGTKYSYTAAGRLSTRLWARGTNTTYTYNNFGDLSEVRYNDNNGTPTNRYTYTRRGQQDTITRGSNSWKLFYTAAGQLLSEAGTAGTVNGLRVTNAFDAFLRRTSVGSANGATTLTAHDYGYDTAGRLSSAADGTFAATYSYLANSRLVSQIEFTSNSIVKLTTTKTYDNLNRLSLISSAPSASSALSYRYSYNDANQRTRVNLADGSFWIYEYDSLGQVKSGNRYWSDWTPVAGQQFEYGFDDIGNRSSTKAGGDSAGAGLRTAAYTANNLNQITQREVPAYLNVIGAATATATNVNVNDTLAYRKGEYYRVELNPDNSANAVWQSVTNRAVLNGSTNGVTGNAFLPQTPEIFGYDADGNLTNDGRWAYVWDGENRLIRQFAPTTAPSGSVHALTYRYDWQGRRISKTVSNWNGGAWSKVLDEKFVYDGWNLLSSLNASNNAVVLAFLWGTDLSGSLQGAGGVGGLLAVDAKGASVTFPAYDGNGNIIALANAADGTTLATYEYGPFGEVIRASGTGANSNPFRFSTKFQDDETDCLYYGYRFYNQSCGRWLNRDPIEERGGLNLYAQVLNDPISYVDILGLGEWKVTPYQLDLSDPNVSVRATDQNGFHVTYVPSPGECKGGRIVIYQVVSSLGIAGKPPHVDCNGVPGQGCKLPPQIRPRGDDPNSYQDSPGDANSIGVTKWQLTAVAVCRGGCRDALLSTYYFEFENSTRKLDLTVPSNDRTHVRDGWMNWMDKGGAIR
jgi:RHS repeat-associated protein